MKAKFVLMSLLLTIFIQQHNFAQTLPAKIKTFLNGNYKGWNLSPSEKDCNSDVNEGFISGDFNGDKKVDFAVKFTKNKKGYILAFLKTRKSFKAFVLHNYDAEEAKYSSLGVWKKGEVFEYNDKSFRLKYDAPSDYRCESDVGGIHYYQNGKFVGY